MARRRKRQHNERLAKLFLDILKNPNRPSIVASCIAKYFSANSCAIWIRDSHTVDEFGLWGAHNRPDLQENESSYFFMSEKDTIAYFAFDQNKAVYARLGQPPFDENWLKKSHTRGLMDLNLISAYMTPIRDHGGRPLCMLSLYFNRDFAVDRFQLSIDLLSSFLSATITNVLEVANNADSERRKMGHEITAAVNSAAKALSQIKHEFQSSSTVHLEDLDKALKLIKTSSTRRASDTIKIEAENALFFDFRFEYNSASQPIIQQYDPNRIHLGQMIMAEPCDLLMSEVHFRHVVQNLLTNAIKYSIVGGTIQASFHRDIYNNAVFVMSNISKGIPSKERSYIWNEGFRGSSARESRLPGEGFGLSVVRQICEVYKIDYRYYETSGESGVVWSRFEFVFPANMVRWRSPIRSSPHGYVRRSVS